jgi:ornithine decarboxylase
MLQRPVVSDTPAKHLATEAGELPVHFYAPSALDARLQTFKAHFPGVVTYAVKANPADHVVSQLWAGGLDGFDVASPDEMALIRRLCPGAAMHYNNPVRSRSASNSRLRAAPTISARNSARPRMRPWRFSAVWPMRVSARR